MRCCYCCRLPHLPLLTFSSPLAPSSFPRVQFFSCGQAFHLFQALGLPPHSVSFHGHGGWHDEAREWGCCRHETWSHAVSYRTLAYGPTKSLFEASQLCNARGVGAGWRLVNLYTRIVYISTRILRAREERPTKIILGRDVTFFWSEGQKVGRSQIEAKRPLNLLYTLSKAAHLVNFIHKTSSSLQVDVEL